MLILLLTATEFETTCTGDAILPPKHPRLCFSISSFTLPAAWPKLNCLFSGSGYSLIHWAPVEPQTGFWQPVSMPVLINRGQTLTECEVCSSCWASPLLPALSLPYSLPPLCFSFGGDFALPHHIFQAVWRCFLCTIFSITQWCCILVLDDATFPSSLNGHRTDSILWISISMRKDSCCCVNSFFFICSYLPTP